MPYLKPDPENINSKLNFFNRSSLQPIEKMITPPFLQPDDTVGLIAPAYRIEPAQWEPVVPLLQSWGLRIEIGNSLRLQDRVFAGSDL